MMKAIKFTKMVASGNDFVVIQGQCEAKRSLPEGDKATSHKLLARKICDRKYGVGADGLLLLEKSKVADVRMRIFNADGSEAEMCGNGARCVALYVSHKVTRSQGHKLRIETRAGVIAAEVKKEQVKIKLTDPRNIKLDIPIKVGNRNIKVNFINTGVPHTVVFVEGLEKISVPALGRQIRFHRCFASAGTNVDFVEAISNDSIQVRTYERGVEDETLACGTGSVASALVFALTMDYGLRTTD
ncbi:MAG: diaminopimelate epimerase [Candidatus Omnitrophota bacterium]|nr:diaminopimelate epimerase [Candidatus Omnitrophota bacterium]